MSYLETEKRRLLVLEHVIEGRWCQLSRQDGTVAEFVISKVHDFACSSSCGLILFDLWSEASGVVRVELVVRTVEANYLMSISSLIIEPHTQSNEPIKVGDSFYTKMTITPAP